MKSRKMTTAALVLAMTPMALADPQADAFAPPTPEDAQVAQQDVVEHEAAAQQVAELLRARQALQAKIEEAKRLTEAARQQAVDMALEAHGNVDFREIQGRIQNIQLDADQIMLDLPEPGAAAPARVILQGVDGERRVRMIVNGEALANQDLRQRIDPKPQQPAELVSAAFLGVNCEPVDLDTAKLLGLPRTTGLIVGFVAPDSPAEAAGLVQADVLTKLNDQVLINPEQLAVLIRTHNAGDAVTLHVLRAGEPIALTAELAEHEVVALGPGGAELRQQWRVQQHQPQFVIPFDPGFQLNRDALNERLTPEAIERLIEQYRQAAQGDRGEQLRQRMEQSRELMERLLMERAEQERIMREIRNHLDVDLDQIRRRMIEEVALNGGGVMLDAKSEAVFNDGTHQIRLTTNNASQHLVVTDRQGAVLYDAPVPAEGRQQAFEQAGMSAELQQKINQMLGQVQIRIGE